ncbi:hypothetical protein ACFLXI_01545, partial [Chloroflexota bacterium]
MHINGFYKQDQDSALRCDFHPGQWRAWEGTARFVFVLSGAQGGKTSFGPPWLHREIKARGPGDYHVMDCERCLWSLLGERRGLGESVIIPPSTSWQISNSDSLTLNP